MPAPYLAAADVLALTALLFLVKAFGEHRRRRGLVYPPGPTGLPLIGNLLDVPKKFSWVQYAKWGEQYGDVISIQVPGDVIVVLNSHQAAKDLLERRGDIYLDRPTIPFFDMMGWQWFLPTAQYNEYWRAGRNFLDRALRPAAASQYRPMQEEKVHAFLRQLLGEPEGFREHIEHLQNRLIMSLTYGYDAKDRNDKFVEIAIKATSIGSATSIPGAVLVNHLPFCIHSGVAALVKLQAARKEGYDIGQETIHSPYEMVKHQMKAGIAHPSLALDSLQESENLPEVERESVRKARAEVLGSLFIAGADTTVSSLTALFLALALHPEVQRLAQDQIDSVVGNDRLPNYHDRPQLPHGHGIVFSESPILNRDLFSGVPHRATRDDVYKGYLIPKGCIVIANGWAILHDADVFPDPDLFRPDRFLAADGSFREDLSVTSAFGYGKRICPGRHIVDSTLFIVVASVLAVFNVNKARDGNGQDLPLDATAFGGVSLSHPLPFKCSITSRSQQARDIINATSPGTPT
ncbi:cytochrome P450 [Gloeopeniophorella convolvens]|nr:cytochrome P450 [Gloeopeniophorella convolvens]